jgi:hypothetical protein
MNAQVKPLLFPVSSELEALKRRARDVANNRYDAGFNAGEAVGFAKGVREGRQEVSFYIVATAIVFGVIGAVVGAGAALMGWFV